MNVRPLDPGELDAPAGSLAFPGDSPVTPMRIPDPFSGGTEDGVSFGAFVSDALRSTGQALTGADRAERAFLSGTGGLAEMVFERAQADVMLASAATAASRATQSVQALLNMQV